MDTATTTPFRTSTEVVRDGLRTMILRGELPPGTAIVMADVAARFGVSITPIREAIRDLAGVGLLSSFPYRGAVVSTMTGTEALELQRIRCLLQPEIARRAAQSATEEQLETLHALVAAMADEADQADGEARFNATLLAAAGSPRMAAIASALDDRMVLAAPLLAEARAAWHPPLAFHRQLVGALRQREEHRAAAIAERQATTILTALARMTPQTDTVVPALAS